MFRVAGACVLFWAVSLFMKPRKISRPDMWKLVWLSLFGVVINQIFFIWGLNLTSPINSAIIMISNPIMVFIFTVVMFGVPLTIVKINTMMRMLIMMMALLRWRVADGPLRDVEVAITFTVVASLRAVLGAGGRAVLVRLPS